MLLPLQARAQSLESLLTDTVENHDRVLAAKADVASARSSAREALGDWFPELETTLVYGWESQEKHEAANTSTPFKELDLSLTQLLWDFGKTNASVESARLDLESSRATLDKTRRDIILEAAQAYANLLRAGKILDYAKSSEENIRKQTGLEEARVETGSGLSTDVLQAKRELAAAEARRIDSEGSLISSENRFQAVFGFRTGDSSGLTRLTANHLPLPESLEAALAEALENNPDLIIARIDEDSARQDIREARAEEFFPTIEGTVERKWKYDVAGTLEYKGETLAKVEMSLPLNLGLTGIDAVDSAIHDLVSKQRTLADTRRTVEESVRNAWQQLTTARNKARSLRNQEAIAGAFLDLARQERALGQRSLIDVLSGETALINAQSDAASAETDVVIAAYDLLNAVGALAYETFGAVAPEPAVEPETPEEVAAELGRQPDPGRRVHFSDDRATTPTLTEPPSLRARLDTKPPAGLEKEEASEGSGPDEPEPDEPENDALAQVGSVLQALGVEAPRTQEEFGDTLHSPTGGEGDVIAETLSGFFQSLRNGSGTSNDQP